MCVISHCVITITMVILTMVQVSATPCCKNDSHGCAQGVPTSLKCLNPVIVTRENLVTIDSRGNLITNNLFIPPTEYCTTMVNDTEIYLVCANDVVDNSPLNIQPALKILAVVTLLLTAAVYTATNWQDMANICVINWTLALALTSLVPAATQQLSSWEPLQIRDYFFFFIFQYFFFWWSLHCWHVWRAIVESDRTENDQTWPLSYYIFGVGGPSLLLMAFIFSSVEHVETPAEHRFWFEGNEIRFLYMYGPVAILVFINAIFLLLSVIAAIMRRKTVESKIWVTLGYFLIAEVVWIFEVMSATVIDLQVFWKLTDGVNACQGILCFLGFVIFRKDILQLIFHKVKKCVAGDHDNANENRKGWKYHEVLI